MRDDSLVLFTSNIEEKINIHYVLFDTSGFHLSVFLSFGEEKQMCSPPITRLPGVLLLIFQTHLSIFSFDFFFPTVKIKPCVGPLPPPPPSFRVSHLFWMNFIKKN